MTVHPTGTPLRPLPISGWAVRLTPARQGRRALEVYADGLLMDVAAASDLGPVALRGRWRGRRDGEDWALAWGQLRSGGPPPVVTFGGRPDARPRMVLLGGHFWVAERAGRFRTVLLDDGTGPHRERLRRYRGR